MPIYTVSVANINTGQKSTRDINASSREEAQLVATKGGDVLCEPRASTFSPAVVSKPAPKTTEQAVFWGIMKAVGVLFGIAVVVSILYGLNSLSA